MRLSVTAVPNSKIASVEKISDKEYRVKVDKPPKEGKANKRLAEILSVYFNVPKSSVKILKGESGKHKLVEIPG